MFPLLSLKLHLGEMRAKAYSPSFADRCCPRFHAGRTFSKPLYVQFAVSCFTGLLQFQFCLFSMFTCSLADLYISLVLIDSQYKISSNASRNVTIKIRPFV